MKSIDTLVKDMVALLDPDNHSEIDDEAWNKFTDGLRHSFERHLVAKDVGREPKLYMSSVGRPCHRELWYKINEPAVAEKLRPEVFLKFLLGDIYEHILLFLARQAGHDVVGEQDLQEFAGLRGRRDAIIDGVVVDVKSASSRSFDKFVDGKIHDDDPFGYIDQLQLYLRSAENDDLVKEHDIAAFLVVNKELGKIHLTKVARNAENYDDKVTYIQGVVARPEPPDRPFEDTEDGKSGNRKLKLPCNYCDFKRHCWPGLRTFLYSNGPRYLTNVQRVPDVPEVKEPNE